MLPLPLLPIRDNTVHAGCTGIRMLIALANIEGYYGTSGKSPERSYQMTRDQIKYANALNIVVGIWLILAAFALGFTDVSMALWNSVTVGVAIIVVSALRISSSSDRWYWLSWITFLLGLWLIASPFILGYGDQMRPMASDVFSGIAVVLLSGFSGLAHYVSGYPPESA